MELVQEQEMYRVVYETKSYVFDEMSPILSRVTAAGKELLTAPVKIIYRNGNSLCSFLPSKRFRILNGKNDSLTFSACTETDTAVVDTVVEIGEDGCLDVSLSLMPRGLSVAQVFGLDNTEVTYFDPTQLWVEMSVSADAVRYFHTFPVGGYNRDGVQVGNDPLMASDFMPQKELYTPFKAQILLLGDDCGVGMFFENDQLFENTDADRVMEIRPEGDHYLLRIRLLDKKPSCWENPEGKAPLATHLFPLTFRFGIQVLPVRVWDKAAIYERNLHMDCFKKTPGNYEDYLAASVVDGSSEIGYDRLKRLGVKVLYIHEKWNDLQNSPLLTEATDTRLRTIIRECHCRGIKVVPYFGYEISVLSPLWAKLGRSVLRCSFTEDFGWHWYRYPYQRAIPVCMHSEWKEIFFQGITSLQQEYGFDGFYLDSTVPPELCKNRAHGCGFEKDGELHGSYPVWDIRDLMMRLGHYCQAHDLILNIHGCSAMNLGALAYYGSIWDGETFQAQLLKGTRDVVPEGLLRAMFTGINTGIPVYSLCYSNPPAWTFREACTIALLHGSFPKPVDIGEPLELMSSLWKIFDDFDLTRAEFHGYWKGEGALVLSGDTEIKCSYYETEREILAIVGGMHRAKELHACLTGNGVLTDAENGEIVSESGTVELTLNGFAFRLLRMNK